MVCLLHFTQQYYFAVLTSDLLGEKPPGSSVLTHHHLQFCLLVLAVSSSSQYDIWLRNFVIVCCITIGLHFCLFPFAVTKA